MLVFFALGNTKVLSFALADAKVPNASSFALQWNIGLKLENVHNYNYLGVIVDDKLSFTDFTDNKYNKVNMRLYHLKRLRPYINNEIANRIYKQTILPLMDYSDLMIESSS